MITAKNAATRVMSARIQKEMDALESRIIEACDKDATEAYITVEYELWQHIRLRLVELGYQTESLRDDQYKVKWEHMT